MQIGIYLPSLIPGVGVDAARTWARRAEALGLDVLAITERGADEPTQPVDVALAAAAATGHVTLFGDITAGPAWTPDTHAGHTAALDEATGGRYLSSLTLPDAALDEHLPGGLRAVDATLARIHRVRRTLPPARTPLRLVISGRADLVARRVTHFGHGWFLPAGTPEQFAEGLGQVRAAWTAAGRPGRPTATAAFHYALGDDARNAAEATHARYHDERGPEFVQAVIGGSVTDEAGIRDRVAAFAAAGADRVLAVPARDDQVS